MDHFYYNFDEMIFSIFDGLTPLELNVTILQEGWSSPERSFKVARSASI
jgi:hypothetical protein